MSCPLFAIALAASDDPLIRLWQATTVLREHHTAHDAAEAATDEAAARPWNRMGSVRLGEIADVFLPLAEACAAGLPEVTPAGRVRPTRP